MVNPLSNLEIKGWYHIMIVTGLFLFVLSLTVEFVGVNNNIIQLFSLSMFFYGLGELINHPHQQIVRHPDELIPTFMIGSGNPRKNSFTGVLFLCISVMLLLASIYKMLF